VGNQFLAATRAWTVFTVAEEDVLASGKGFGAELLVERIRL
jgi:hypothetical protein